MMVEVITITWNEERYLQDFINFYRYRLKNCKITIYDNNSTDNTVLIGKKNNCNVVSFDTGETMDEYTLTHMRTTKWKSSEADWVIVVDADEMVDVWDKDLENAKWNVNTCIGYEMYGQDTDTLPELRYGVPSAWYNKSCLFNAKQIDSVISDGGCHNSTFTAKPNYSVIYNPKPYNLYHTKWRSLNYVLERTEILAKRRSDHTIKNGWNGHYSRSRYELASTYIDGMYKRRLVR
jgi:hypothetical protein